MLPKDLAQRSSHVTTKELKVFGETFPAGTAVKFRPVQVMRRCGEIEIGSKQVAWNRHDCWSVKGEENINRRDISKLADALEPPASEWNSP